MLFFGFQLFYTNLKCLTSVNLNTKNRQCATDALKDVANWLNGDGMVAVSCSTF